MSDRLTYVLLPGLDGTGDLFERFSDATRADARSVIVRYPREEILERDQLVDLVAEATPVGPHVLIAESFSGPIALQLARRADPSLVALVLCNSFATPPVWPGWRHAPLALLLRIRPPRLVMRRLLLDDTMPESWLSRVREVVCSVPPAVLAARIREVLATDARHELASCPVPVMYLRGEHDRLVPNKVVDEVRGIRTSVVYREIPGPHLLLQCNPVGAALAIRSFVDTLDLAG